MKIKILIKGVVVLAAVGSLAGCANFKGLLGPTPAQVKQRQYEQKAAAVRESCNTAPVVYANLKAPVAKRIYSLPVQGALQRDKIGSRQIFNRIICSADNK